MISVRPGMTFESRTYTPIEIKAATPAIETSRLLSWIAHNTLYRHNDWVSLRKRVFKIAFQGLIIVDNIKRSQGRYVASRSEARD